MQLRQCLLEDHLNGGERGGLRLEKQTLDGEKIPPSQDIQPHAQIAIAGH